MLDELVSFTTAKLAKEKGFDEETWYFYGDLFIPDRPICGIWDRGPEHWNFDEEYREDHMACPTQSLLQRWLRKKHGYHINITAELSCGSGKPMGLYYDLEVVRKIPDDNKFVYYIYSAPFFDSYEEALEVGLLQALNQL